MTKLVLTYTMLAKKAIAMYKDDPGEYLKLMEGGSDKLVPGATIAWAYASNYRSGSSFELMTGSEGNRVSYCSIRGHVRDGKWYTTYEPAFTTTQYRKALHEKFLPFVMPDGVRSKDNVRGRRTKCIFHNPDGSVAKEVFWFGGGRGRPGKMVQYDANRDTEYLPAVICDTDGKAVLDRDLYQNQYMTSYNEEVGPSLGFFPGASKNRDEWVRSLIAMPHVDTQKMMALGAKTYLAAVRMAEKYPALKVILFPACPAPEEDSALLTRYPDHEQRQTVIHRDELNMPVLYILPSVVLYWKNPQPSMLDRYTYLSMTLPPCGSEQLDPMGRSSHDSGTIRDPKDYVDISDGLTAPKYLEMAYHSIPAYREEIPVSDRHRIYRNWRTIPYMDNQSADRGSYYDEKMVNWSAKDGQGKVHVKVEGKEDETIPFDDVAVAMKPEDVALRLEERFLLDSLPLC
jgi:hypothetical protein